MRAVYHTRGWLTRDAGSETGSNEKFSMRFACMRDFCRVEDKLRSSSSAWGLNGPSSGAFAVPVTSATSLTASLGSISSWTSLKRTDWAGGDDVMMVGGCKKRVLSERVSYVSRSHDERPRCLGRGYSSSLLGCSFAMRAHTLGRPELRIRRARARV